MNMHSNVINTSTVRVKIDFPPDEAKVERVSEFVEFESVNVIKCRMADSIMCKTAISFTDVVSDGNDDDDDRIVPLCKEPAPLKGAIL